MNILLQAKLKVLAGIAAQVDGVLAQQMATVLAAHAHDAEDAKQVEVADDRAALDLIVEVHEVVALQASGAAAELAGHLAGLLAEHDRHVPGDAEYLRCDADLVATVPATTAATAGPADESRRLAARDARIAELEDQLAQAQRQAEADATAARIAAGAAEDQLEQVRGELAAEQRRAARAEQRAEALGGALEEAQGRIADLQEELAARSRTQVAADVSRQMQELVDAVARLG